MNDLQGLSFVKRLQHGNASFCSQRAAVNVHTLSAVRATPPSMCLFTSAQGWTIQEV